MSLIYTQWKTLEQHLPEVRNGGICLSFRNWIYYFGGRIDSTTGTRNTVLRAQVLPDGQTTPWQTIGTMPEAASGMLGTIHDGWVYLTPSSAAAVANYTLIMICKINGDGSLGPWKRTPLPLNYVFLAGTRGRGNGMALVVGGRLHLVGGLGDSPAIGNSSSAKLEGSGDLGPWRDEPVTFPDGGARSRGGPVWEHQGYLYVLGGTVGVSRSSQIWSAPVNPNTGEVGVWSPVGEYPQGGINLCSNGIKFRNKIIFVGGLVDVPVASTGTGMVFAVDLLPGGGLGAWQRLEDCPNPASAIVTCMVANRLYAIGGLVTGGASTLDTVSMIKLG